MPDQVTIKFGPAKLTSPKAIRDSIADTAVQTQADTIAEVTNNTSINVGGSVTGTVAQVATIDTFDPYTNLGTATFNLDNISLNYTNATGSYLNPGDEVVILEDTNTDYTAVAVYQRMPSVPGSIPAAGIAPGFPIDVTNAANKMSHVSVYGTTNISCIYDEQGIYSGYSDTILNLNNNSPALLNGYSRSISQSISTGITLSYYNSWGDIHYQTNGRIWITNNDSYNPSVRYSNPGSGVFTQLSTVIPAGHTLTYGFTCDYSNGWVWFSIRETSTGSYKLCYVEPTMPFSIVVFQTYTYPGNLPYHLFADNGYLFVKFGGMGSDYIARKPSGNTNALTTLCFVGSEQNYFWGYALSRGKGAASIDGKLSIIRDGSTNSSTYGFPPTIMIDTYSTLGKSSFDTGLSFTDSPSSAKVDSISWSPSGFLVITFATAASYFGMGTGTEWLPGVMITNFSSISYPFVDPAMMTTPIATSTLQNLKVGNSNIVRRSDGSMIWVTATANTSANTITLNDNQVLSIPKTRIYELTGL